MNVAKGIWNFLKGVIVWDFASWPAICLNPMWWLWWWSWPKVLSGKALESVPFLSLSLRHIWFWMDLPLLLSVHMFNYQSTVVSFSLYSSFNSVSVFQLLLVVSFLVCWIYNTWFHHVLHIYVIYVVMFAQEICMCKCTQYICAWFLFSLKLTLQKNKKQIILFLPFKLYNSGS